MKAFGLVFAFTIALVGPASLSPCENGAALASPGSFACCKVCKAGKACGDSCIAADANCTKGKGCACNG